MSLWNRALDEHSDKQNPTQELPKWINSEKKSWFSNLKPWSVVFLPTQWKPDNNASNFPFALISLLSPGRELLILTTQKSASLTKFFVYPPTSLAPPTKFVLAPQPTQATPRGGGVIDLWIGLKNLSTHGKQWNKLHKCKLCVQIETEQQYNVDPDILTSQSSESTRSKRGSQTFIIFFPIFFYVWEVII